MKPQVGMKFGDLKITGKCDLTREGVQYYHCQCWCGTYRKVAEHKLVRDEVTMCVPCEARAKMEKPLIEPHG
jgi:predicted SprT family Zn-dependent metalloprotease